MITAANSDGSYSKPKANPQIYGRIAALNSSVCTYSRLGVLTAVAFVEAFVNSVGWNEASNPQRSEQERLELQGIHKGNYLSLEKKLEKFSRIICDDNSTPIILSDPRQRREPFISFLKTAKEVRDASMHYAPGKAPIHYPPLEWLQLLESSVKDAVAVAREFWSACYPGRRQPQYLAGLFYDGLVRAALDKLKATEDSVTST